MLKNLLDWISRPNQKDEPMYSAFKGKAAAVMSASPGALGGLRGLVHIRVRAVLAHHVPLTHPFSLLTIVHTMCVCVHGTMFVQDILGYLGVNVIADQVAVGGSFSAFDEAGNLTNPQHQKMVEATCLSLWEMAAALANRSATCAVAKAQREAIAAGEYGNIIIPTGFKQTATGSQ